MPFWRGNPSIEMQVVGEVAARVCVCVCVCLLSRATVHSLCVSSNNTRHPRLSALEELTSCVDVLRLGYSQPQHPFGSDRLSSLGGPPRNIQSRKTASSSLRGSMSFSISCASHSLPCSASSLFRMPHGSRSGLVFAQFKPRGPAHLSAGGAGRPELSVYQGRRRTVKTLRRQPQVAAHQGHGIHEGRRRLGVPSAVRWAEGRCCPSR